MFVSPFHSIHPIQMTHILQLEVDRTYTTGLAHFILIEYLSLHIIHRT